MSRVTVTWKTLWAELDAGEQGAAIEAFVHLVRHEEGARGLRDYVHRRLAKVLRFRPRAVERLSEERVARHLRAHLGQVIDHQAWEVLFKAFYRARRSDLMAAFLETAGIPQHDGMVSEPIEEQPSPATARAAARALLQRFPAGQVLHYLRTLTLCQPDWEFVAAALDEAERSEERPRASALPRAPAEPDTGEASVLDEFTTLDRVLIDQIVATVSGEEGSLDAEQLEDLVHTVVELNHQRRRSHFHLGMIDGLLPGHEPRMDRPESNDERREWYLAGLLAACTRRGDAARLRALLDENAADFTRAAHRRGGAGAVMANQIFGFLLEAGCRSEALALLDGQLGDEGYRLAVDAYVQATTLLRDRADPASALAILRILREKLPGYAEDEVERIELGAELDRRYGQCLQAEGRLRQAAQTFEAALASAGEHVWPDLPADLGLVKAGFRALSEVRLPAREDRRRELEEALAKGETEFERAVEAHGSRAPNACYALAVLRYLRYADSGAVDASARARVLELARLAVEGMTSSRSAAAYRRLGVLGQAQFLVTVTHMEELNRGEARLALAPWEQITEEAGKFPLQDVARLLLAAEMLDPEVAARIAQSAWEVRGREVAEVLLELEAATLGRCPGLVEELLGEARSPEVATESRFRHWLRLVPVLLALRRIEEAEEGLDVLESLAEEETGLSAELAAWLEDSAHFDPAWSRGDAEWARLRLARRAGSDQDCAAILHGLFFALRDESPEEARQLLGLARSWRLGEDLAARLEAALPEEESGPESEPRGADGALRAGAKVDLLFVGGNEVQARYDESIRALLAREWPGLTVRFEHTGWSANWGRRLDPLVRAASAVDVVVTMRMMRTMLGRRLREGLEVPWVACTGTGREAMLASIRTAARLAARRSEPRVGKG